MGLIKPGVKTRLETVTEIIKTSYHVAFIPFVIYMGFKKGPEVGGPAFGLLRSSYADYLLLDIIYWIKCGTILSFYLSPLAVMYKTIK